MHTQHALPHQKSELEDIVVRSVLTDGYRHRVHATQQIALHYVPIAGT